jgi:SAM-dependent methyltransferase
METLTLVWRACPICGSRENSRLFAETNVAVQTLDRFNFASRKIPDYMHWRLMECRRCDVLYADPAPPPEELAPLYRNADFDSAAEARHASRTYAGFLPRIAKQLPDQVGAVDVGTGDGAFLRELLAAGFSGVVGVEPSTAPINAAEEFVRPLIRHDFFRPRTFPPSSLVLATCFQTIEHLANPLAFCRDAWMALKPGGAVFLVGHNWRAASAKILGRKSPIFDLEHLQLFSPVSIRRLLEAAAFVRIEVLGVYNRYPIHYWVRLLPVPPQLKATLCRHLKASRVGNLLVPLPAGNIAAIAYK